MNHIVKLNIEQNPAMLYTLYAALRRFKEFKEQSHTKSTFSLCAAEASDMLEQIKEQFPKEYEQCAIEYNDTYNSESANKN